MNIMPWVALYLLTRHKGGPSWPGPKSPPPRAPRKARVAPGAVPNPPPVPAGPAVLENAAPAPKAVPHADRPPTVAPRPLAPAAATSQVVQPTEIADAQKILKALGFRDREGKLSDGLYGSLTASDWELAAQHRGIDPTFERLGPTTAHVNPATLARLRKDAMARGGVSGRTYIP